MGCTWTAVFTTVCTTEGCTDSMSTTRRFLWGCVRCRWKELVDSPMNRRYQIQKILGFFPALFVDRDNTYCKASIGEEVESSISSADWLVGGSAMSGSEFYGAGICEAEVDAVCVVISVGAKFDGTFGILARIARAILERLDKSSLAVSFFRCFILGSVFWIVVITFVWLRILASV